MALAWPSHYYPSIYTVKLRRRQEQVPEFSRRSWSRPTGLKRLGSKNLIWQLLVKHLGYFNLEVCSWYVICFTKAEKYKEWPKIKCHHCLIFNEQVTNFPFWKFAPARHWRSSISSRSIIWTPHCDESINQFFHWLGFRNESYRTRINWKAT